MIIDVLFNMTVSR